MSRDAGTRIAPPERSVERMFDRVVPRYDLVNALLSMGLDSSWRKRTARACRASAGERVLDLGCGTGKLGASLIPRATVVGIDVSERMLLAAQRDLGGRLRLVRGSAFRLPFADSSFVGTVSGFVLRNLDDLPAVFSELARVVAPGGTIALVDITGPRSGLLRAPFDAYFGTVAPLLGRVVGASDAYRYLARSLAQLPSPEDVCAMLETAGFAKCEARGMTGGMVTLWTAVRPTR